MSTALLHGLIERQKGEIITWCHIKLYLIFCRAEDRNCLTERTRYWNLLSNALHASSDLIQPPHFVSSALTEHLCFLACVSPLSLSKLINTVPARFMLITSTQRGSYSLSFCFVHTWLCKKLCWYCQHTQTTIHGKGFPMEFREIWWGCWSQYSSINKHASSR